MDEKSTSERRIPTFLEDQRRPLPLHHRQDDWKSVFWQSQVGTEEPIWPSVRFERHGSSTRRWFPRRSSPGPAPSETLSPSSTRVGDKPVQHISGQPVSAHGHGALPGTTSQACPLDLFRGHHSLLCRTTQRGHRDTVLDIGMSSLTTYSWTGEVTSKVYQIRRLWIFKLLKESRQEAQPGPSPTCSPEAPQDGQRTIYQH